MKKFLSLVLALVMTMSLVTVSAGAKDFTDSSKINYAEAVDVLSEAKVIDGYADGAFNPSNTLTRGAAAKIICNLILGPTAASALVADAAPYKDVAANHPFAGYIAYCQKTGIISGYADGTFKPANSLTGYAFMKMLLGALGYDAANEGYTGANWSINVAKQAISIGLNDGLKGEFNGVKALETALKNLNEVSKDTYSYEFSAYIEDGIATTVVIRDLTAGEYEGSKPATKADYTFDGLTAYVNDNGAIKFSEATCAAISGWELGTPATVEYTISVNGSAARTYKQTLTSSVAMSGLAGTMTVPGLTVKNGSNLEINVVVTFKGTGTDTNTYTVSGTCYIV